MSASTFCKNDTFFGATFFILPVRQKNNIMQQNYIKRRIDSELLSWKLAPNRKPLLLRGARQVGKSSSVRQLGRHFEFFAEVNLDEKRSFREVFARDMTPRQICDELSVLCNIPIVPGRTLLFFDEIQSCPAAISALRYFYEQMPELHLVAAGSLLEFALRELPSFGVGRVRSLFMFPFSFDEYLRATGENLLADALKNASPEHPFSDAVHQKCIRQFVRFIFIGGMPEVVAAYAQNNSLTDCRRILDDLLISIFDDFAKYKARVPAPRLREVLASVMRQIGNKFVYNRASETSNHTQIKECVDLLEMAGLIHPVTHTSGNGLPLAAEQNTKFRKYLIFDTGVFQRFLNLDASEIFDEDTLGQINKGALADLFAGLELLKTAAAGNPAQLFYWQREERGSNAEVDYLVQRGADVVPVEIKSGRRGAMQSLHLFLSEKKSPYGVRCSLENFGLLPNVLIYPLYAAGHIPQF